MFWKRIRLTIGRKIYAIIALSFVGFVAATVLETRELGASLARQKEIELTHLTEMATGIIQEEYAAAQKGTISDEEARKRAAARVGALRYDKDNYFWITDMHPRLIMHPLRAELVGRDMTDFKDARGKQFYKEFAEVVRKQGAGFVPYDQNKPGVQEPQPKLTRAVGFAPWGWIVCTGVYIDDLNAQTMDAARRAFMVTGLVLLLVVIVSILVGRDVAKAMRGTTGAMRELAAGRLDVVLPGLGRRDEVGEIAAAVESFKLKAAEKAHIEAQEREAKARAEAEERAGDEKRILAEKQAVEERLAAERRDSMRKLADDFEAAVGGIVNSVSSASTELEAASATLAKTAENTQALAGSVAAASEQATGNVHSVASATEELTSSVSAIGQQVQQSTTITQEAVHQAEATDQRIAELSQAAARIGDVVKLITAIAEQTNLLALNATIEAARAGEAGKGFAVVAQEVKALAGQTAKATSEISTQISEMQSATQASVAAIKQIGGTIERVSQIAAAIATTVDQQGTTTSEISRNINQAAQGTEEVATHIANVNRGASETGTASVQVLSSAQQLAGESNRLKLEVEKFLATVRAA